MVDLLEPGSEAETCRMAGRWMNGLRGIIVCYNPHNSRYTLELEAGDMMCLRSRNVRAVKSESGNVYNDEDDKPSDPLVAIEEACVYYRKDANRDTSSKVKSSLPKTISNRVEEERGRDDTSGKVKCSLPNIPSRVLELALLGGLLLWCLVMGVPGVTASSIVSVGLVIFFVSKFGTKDGTRAFSFRNVKTSLPRLSIWETVLVANVLERGLSHVTRRR
ncbi:hypothetical protein THAOC_05207 [Thalassiosira oceanica]|uniref:Uncharacterized protein n=1 Tax=Thalassiosira oceanica TaxID=159749 RepID=K0TN50_THAOC|nr:hypothetical protein THAOC_05207 [Thalassiosira oceanica]|eukprot:EJK73182.1 hypothetical protein THAOC_05207 [Thalassiosira oceanica]